MAAAAAVVPRCSREQQQLAAAKLAEADQQRQDGLNSDALNPRRDTEWHVPGSSAHTGIFIRDASRTAAGKKVWWKAFYAWRGWESQTFGEKASAALNEIYENAVGRKLIDGILATNPRAPSSTSTTPPGYRVLVVPPFDVDPTDDMQVHEHDFAESELILDRILNAELTPDQVREAKAALKTEWNLARARIGECYKDHTACKEVLGARANAQGGANQYCPIPAADAKIDAATDLAALRTVAGQMKAFIDGTPRYWSKGWRDGSHIANTSWSGPATDGTGSHAVVVWNPTIDHLPGVHVADSNGARTWEYVRYTGGQAKATIGANTAIPISLTLAHELIHALHRLQGISPRAIDTGKADKFPTLPHFQQHCSAGGTWDADGLQPGVGRDWSDFRAHEEWRTVGLYGTTPPERAWPACARGADVSGCDVTENNVRGAWRVLANGSPGQYPHLPSRASYNPRIDCRLDEDGPHAEGGGYSPYSAGAEAEAGGAALEGALEAALDGADGAWGAAAGGGDEAAALAAAAGHAPEPHLL